MKDSLDRLDQEFQTWVAALPDGKRPPELTAFMKRLDALVNPPMLPPGEMLGLQDAASELSDCADMWNPYDMNRSSNGQEFVTGPQSAGWFALFNGQPVKVEITYVTDEVLRENVYEELDPEGRLTAPPDVMERVDEFLDHPETGVRKERPQHLG